MPDEHEIRALPFVSVRGRVYIDLEALLAYLAGLGNPPAPPPPVEDENENADLEGR